MSNISAIRQTPEGGYTLAELLIVLAILGFVMAAVLGIYQTTQQSYLFATAGEDAQLTARAVLDRIVSEFRMINNGRVAPEGAITQATASSITFLADVNNDTLTLAGAEATFAVAASGGATSVQVSSGSGFSAGELLSITDGAIRETQTITAVSGATLSLGPGLSQSYPVTSFVRSVETVAYSLSGGALTREVGGGGAQPIASGVLTFQLTYWDGSIPPVQITDVSTQANRDTIREIRVQLTVSSKSGDQTIQRTMQATVRPRNLL
jgi:prepilin-type N-terminal cleavage/methylation domain-containing protein